jgi:outer membrane lipopolysaccharide assembly protein LptE/RlpB
MCGEHGGSAADGEDSVSAARVSSTESRVPSETTWCNSFFSGLSTRDSELRSGFLSLPGTRCSVLAVFVLLLCTGCGYHTAGHVVTAPESLQTIAIPVFKNDSNTYRIGQMLTAAVVREFTARTRYQILHEASDDADATLQGTVLSTAATPLAYDTNTGRAASVLVVVSVSVTLTDRHGKVLYQNPQYLFREQYELSQDLTTFFQEDSPALHRLSRDFGRTLVSNLLEGF